MITAVNFHLWEPIHLVKPIPPILKFNHRIRITKSYRFSKTSPESIGAKSQKRMSRLIIKMYDYGKV